MSVLRVRPSKVAGSLRVPGDKSLGHRSLLFAAMAAGRSRIDGLPGGADVTSTRSCVQRLGVKVAPEGTGVIVDGLPPEEWSPPSDALDCGNSGTTMRLMAGLAARNSSPTAFDGDASLRRRPMDRVCLPLTKLGARAAARDGRFPPIRVSGGDLRGTAIETGVASAQVKSALILAALGAEGDTTVIEPAPTRDHTERMLSALGAPIRRTQLPDGRVRVDVCAFTPGPFQTTVPGDPSSAAFLIAAGVLAGQVTVEDVCLNPVRIAFVDAIASMGGQVAATGAQSRLGEPIGSLTAIASLLTAREFAGPQVAALMDELPLLAVVATQAEGATVVRDAAELRVKESDRIAAISDGLTRLGADITPLQDGFVVRGPTPLTGAAVDGYGDHRIAMALAVAGLACEGEVTVTGFDAADISWPGFDRALASIGADCRLEDDSSR